MSRIQNVPPIDGVHKITIPIPFPIESVNVYLLEGSPLSLIDTGLRSEATLDALRNAFAGIGRKLEDLERIFVTHGHIDHFGAARALSDISGARVFVHSLDVSKVNHDFLQDFDQEPSRLALYLSEAGVPSNYYPFLKQEFLNTIHEFSDPLTRVELMADEDEIEAGGRKLKVLYFPGHCLGQVCFFEPEEQLIFTERPRASGNHAQPGNGPGCQRRVRLPESKNLPGILAVDTLHRRSTRPSRTRRTVRPVAAQGRRDHPPPRSTQKRNPPNTE